MTVKMKSTQGSVCRERAFGVAELEEPLVCEAAEVPIGVGFLNAKSRKVRFVLVTH